ncbi:hypothetical protein SLEP1_g18456 [Rubroshorea leprosula]|uniref:Uncharacterized protein n=1 Tax=Rubroshorea leprosula TaxID=152421 RepID=A0AAV5J3D4_9ROSI|nr:hypothetical protein SLEP1_g18456 [Rubroshorea leprosula]
MSRESKEERRKKMKFERKPRSGFAELGSGKPSKAGLDETQQGSLEPRLGSTRPSRVRRNLALLGSGKPSQVGFVEPSSLGLIGTQLAGSHRNPARWVSSEPSKGDPARLGSTRPSRLDSDETQQAGFRRDPAGWVRRSHGDPRQERKKEKERRRRRRIGWVRVVR